MTRPGLVLILLALLVLLAGGCASAPEPCPDGHARTDWCGCLPPVHGDDC